MTNKLIPDLDFKDFAQNLQYDLDNATFDEVVKKYKTTKKQMKEWIKFYKLEIKYEYRTPVTQQLIPITSHIHKYFKNKKQREKYNSLYTKEDIQHQIDWIKDLYKEEEYAIGGLCGHIQTINQQLKQKTERFLFSRQQIDLLEKYGTTDYVTCVAEEKFGTRPTMEDFDQTVITDGMIYAYIEAKYGLDKMLFVQQILEK